MRSPNMTDVWAIGSIIVVGVIGYFFGRGRSEVSFSWVFIFVAAWMFLVSNYHRISPYARAEKRATFVLNPEHAKILGGLRVEVLPRITGWETIIRVLDNDDELWRGEPAEFDTYVKSMRVK